MNSNILGFFPIIYPDELFYSVCSRYAHYTPYRGRDKLNNDLFGSKRMKPSLKFASFLDEFCKRADGLYTPEEILNNHTVYSYFSPFLSRERQERVLEAVSFNANHLLNFVGAKHLFANRNRIRYCPRCFQESFEKNQEVFLHVSHHLDGIDCCPKHLIKLLDYPVQSSSEKAYLQLDPNLLDLNCWIKGSQAEEKLARLAGELIKLPYNQYSIDIIMKYLRAVLINHGLATTKLTYSKKIYTRITEIYSESFLRENNLLIPPEKLKSQNYLSDLFRNRSSAQPVVYLILISLVADSFTEFIQTAQQLVSDEVFPDYNFCHNPFCPDYNKPVARRVSVSGNKKGAVYRCHCGQIYRQYSDDPGHYHIVQWGSLYKEVLTGRVEDGVDWKKLEQETGMSRKRLKEQLKRDDFTPIDLKLSMAKRELEESLTRKLQDNVSLTNQNYINNRKYVSVYDPDYIKSFKKLNKVVAPCSNRTKDYSQEDEHYLNQVSVIAEKLYQQDPPVWVSQRLIISYFRPRISESRIKRLSKTKEALTEVSEDRHEFGLRKIVLKMKKLLKIDPNLKIEEANIRKILGMTSDKFKVYWPEIYNLFT